MTVSRSAMLAAWLCLAGCAAPLAPPGAASSSAQQLRALREAWSAAGADCGDRQGLGSSPLADCGRLLAELEALAMRFPQRADVVEAAAVAAFESGETARAVRWLDALLAIAPGRPAAAALRARIALAEGNLGRARRLVATAVEAHPEDAALREVGAAVAYLGGDWDGARAALGAAERLGAPQWRIAFHRGLIAEAEGATLAARAAYERALAARPEFAAAAARLAGLAGDAARGDGG